MTLQKSTVRWLHEAANWKTRARNHAARAADLRLRAFSPIINVYRETPELSHAWN
jgi:hypothetical protein